MKKLVATAPRVAALVEYEDRAILANEVKIRVRQMRRAALSLANSSLATWWLATLSSAAAT